jgi:AbrB family looped-hinge helix DNA binding protein
MLYLALYCKAMAEATLSRKHQIVIPREAREALQMKPGDKLLVVVRDKDVIILRKPESFSAETRGMGRGLYSKGNLKKEGDSWD